MRFYFYFLILLCFSLTSCDKENNPFYVDEIKGLWCVEDLNGEALLTNDIVIYDINSDLMGEYFRYLSDNEQNSDWCQYDLSYAVIYDMLYFNVPNTDKVYEIKIENIMNNIMNWHLIKVKYEDGIVYPDLKYKLRLLDKDYSKDIIGLWEGKCITQGEQQDVHRWRYFADGRYEYLYKNQQGEWVVKSDNNGKYLLFGDIMVNSWLNNDLTGVLGQHCEIWNILIKNDKMNWSATREGNKIIEFELNRVN